ncbi:hypothetical protein CRE_08376 [Caenorhabditis remanei]|uniref:Uncharacterized protein n=1 Tax=Caenorhabditis remanei TaxID=31234 RepID=E3MPE7_CAERE|nr:hypothetical protein CRE_08376 [Caenorhabditis remanei]
MIYQDSYQDIYCTVFCVPLRLVSRTRENTFGRLDLLDFAIRPQLAHLTQIGHWPFLFAHGNTVRLLKRSIQQVEEATNADCKKAIQQYRENTLARKFSHTYKTISQLLDRKIRQFEKVVVFDWCPVVNVLLDAKIQILDMQFLAIDANNNGSGTRHVKSFVVRGYDVKDFTMKGASWASQDVSFRRRSDTRMICNIRQRRCRRTERITGCGVLCKTLKVEKPRNFFKNMEKIGSEHMFERHEEWKKE